MQNVELTQPSIIWLKSYDGNVNWKTHIYRKKFTDEQ